MARQPKKPPLDIAIRARLSIESGKQVAMTEAGADLLDQIEACGSLSEAARRLRFSYRRAWMLIDTMNKRWPRPLVTTAIGGEKGGGTRLTEYGSIVLRSYRELQIELEHLLDRATPTFLAAVRSQA